MTHCRRELLHAQWNVLLDDDFLMAYIHGIVVDCCDTVTRRFHPRFFTYSADYKEKSVKSHLVKLVLIRYRVIVSSIRDLGGCPCPRCLIPMSRVYRMGMVQDMKERKTLARVDDEIRRRKVELARDIIYNKNYAVDNANVEAILKPESLVPTAVSDNLSTSWQELINYSQNAFSSKLGPLGFNMFKMFVFDLMHEVELNVWKGLFIHILRMLDSVDNALLHELDRR